jgi:hypothetical protein
MLAKVVSTIPPSCTSVSQKALRINIIETWVLSRIVLVITQEIGSDNVDVYVESKWCIVDWLV